MKTYIVLLNDRKILEGRENTSYETKQEFINDFEKEIGDNDELLDSFGYYELTDFMDMVNDHILDDLTHTFIGYVFIKN